MDGGNGGTVLFLRKNLVFLSTVGWGSISAGCCCGWGSDEVVGELNVVGESLGGDTSTLWLVVSICKGMSLLLGLLLLELSSIWRVQ